MLFINKFSLLHFIFGILLIHFGLKIKYMNVITIIFISVIIHQIIEYVKSFDLVVSWMIYNGLVDLKSDDDYEWVKYKNNIPINSASDTLFFLLGIVVYLIINDVKIIKTKFS